MAATHRAGGQLIGIRGFFIGLSFFHKGSHGRSRDNGRYFAVYPGIPCLSGREKYPCLFFIFRPVFRAAPVLFFPHGDRLIAE